MDEITTNINVSGIPVEWIPEINKVSNNFSKAVRTLIKEALEARKTKLIPLQAMNAMKNDELLFKSLLQYALRKVVLDRFKVFEPNF